MATLEDADGETKESITMATLEDADGEGGEGELALDSFNFVYFLNYLYTRV
jgi:hypothetical protein